MFPYYRKQTDTTSAVRLFSNKFKYKEQIKMREYKTNFDVVKFSLKQ